ncbi:uncharacterized protein BJX67DRAFT_379421 [Aspergillus lucknowensis]|uniref:Uncharacterized protein n=1 Tax=Aspergillus lucknowensis TaxID=176173 RepID=A0ABR4LWK9_9EURO
MPKYTALIKYDSLDAYRQHGAQIEMTATAFFAAMGATEQAPFFSTRSMPPTHRTSFVLPDGVVVEEWKAPFPEGVRVEISPSQ